MKESSDGNIEKVSKWRNISNESAASKCQQRRNNVCWLAWRRSVAAAAGGASGGSVICNRQLIGGGYPASGVWRNWRRRNRRRRLLAGIASHLIWQWLNMLTAVYL